MTRVSVKTRTKVITATVVGCLLVGAAAWAIYPSLQKKVRSSALPRVQKRIPAKAVVTPKPLWKQRVDALTFTDLRSSVDVEGNLVLSDGRYKVTVSDRAAGDYARMSLHQLKVCTEKIERYIGVRPYLGTTIALVYKSHPTTRISTCCGEAPDYPINNIESAGDLNYRFFGDDVYWKRSDADFVTACLSGHEELHRFVHTSRIAYWFNEGLAQYIEEKFRAEPGTPASENLRECRGSGFVLVGSDAVIPYRKLDTAEFNAEPKVHSYYTAACFWDRVEYRFGRGKIADILRRTFAMRDGEEWISTAVYPAIGRDIRPLLTQMLSIVPE